MSRRKLVLIILSATSLTLILLCFTYIDVWLIIDDEPDKVDAIVCLGGGGGDRLQKTIELYKMGYAPIIILTSSNINNSEFREFTGDLTRRYLIYKGILPQSIIQEFESDNTYSEAKNVKNLMISDNFHSAIIISDAYHMRRTRYVFNKIFQGNNIELFFVPVYGKWVGKPWWGNENSLVFVCNEAVKLLYYWLKY